MEYISKKVAAYGQFVLVKFGIPFVQYLPIPNTEMLALISQKLFTYSITRLLKEKRYLIITNIPKSFQKAFPYTLFLGLNNGS